MRASILPLLIACAVSAFAEQSDVPLSPLRQAPLTGIHQVAVATSGTEYLIVFSRQDALYAQRAALDGAPIDRNPQRLDLAAGAAYSIRAVWTGEAYLVVWNLGQEGVLGQKIARDGAVSPRFTIADERGDNIDALAAAGETAVLVGNPSAGNRLMVFDAGGQALRSSPASPFISRARIVRHHDGWGYLGPGRTAFQHLTLVDPDSGAARIVAADFAITDIYASPGGGALAVTGDGRIGVLSPARDFVHVTFEHPIERLSLPRAVLAAPTSAGWTVLYKSAGSARIACVRNDGTVLSDGPLSGAFPSPGGVEYVRIAATGYDDQHQLLVQPAALGLESIVIAGTEARITGIFAIGDATQRWARVAEGPGVDLVVWLEAGDWAWTIRATRVRDGLPLDGAGLVLASGYPYYPLHAAFDGDHFAVVWMDRDGTFMRRVAIDGAIVDSTSVLLHADASLGAIAAGGDGTLLVAWSIPPMVTIVRDGTPLPALPLQGDPVAFNVVTAAEGPASFLVASIGLLPGCRITCPEMPMAVEARVLTRDGVPLGPVIEAAITDSHNFGLDAPLFLRGAWLLPVQVREGKRLVRMTEMGSPLARVPILGGDLRPTPMGIELWGYAASHPFRGLLSPEGENVRYEPLPVGAEERAAATLGSATLLLERADRYILRHLVPPAESADLALVHRRRTVTATSVVDEVTIEHRGGDPVSAIYVDAWPRFNSGIEIASSRPITFGRIEGPFSPGESIDLVIRGWKNQSENRLVVALPAAREIAAANNFLEISDPPPRPRRRTVRR